jgi:anaerobic selenocysteine-containing dehydrogenase
VLAPASPQLRSEPAIVAGLAAAVLGERSHVPWLELAADYDRIREHVAAVVPGFEDFNARVRGRNGFTLPNPARERRFEAAGGHARFTVHPLPVHQLRPGELLMTTIRSHDQYNTTIYGLDDRYRGISGGRRVVLLNPADMAARELGAGDLVDLHSHFADETRTARRFVVVPYTIPPGCAATYFPEANVLVPLGATAAKSNTPASKSVTITVTRTRGSA